MTNKEAIEILQREDSVCIETDEALEAYELAIEALKNERPQGKWNYIQAGMCVCPFCGASSHKVFKNFCPNCGAEMRGMEKT